METKLSSWKNKSLVEERAYRHGARAYLVDGAWDPQIMKTWGWMVALITSKQKVSENKNKIHLGAVHLLSQPSSLGYSFEKHTPFDEYVSTVFVFIVSVPSTAGDCRLDGWQWVAVPTPRRQWTAMAMATNGKG